MKHGSLLTFIVFPSCKPLYVPYLKLQGVSSQGYEANHQSLSQSQSYLANIWRIVAARL